MNNQVKLIEELEKMRVSAIQSAAEASGRSDSKSCSLHTGRASAFEEIISIINTPPVPTIKPGDTRDAEKILAGVLGEIDKLKLYDSNPKAFKRISDIINGEVVE